MRLSIRKSTSSLLSATHTLLQAPPVARPAERIYQIFGAETLGQLLPIAAESALDRRAARAAAMEA
jgi:hypothetical protein